MKKMILFLIFGMFAFTACSTFSYHKAGNLTSDGGVKIEFGAQQGVHVGDKVNVYENRCLTSSRGGNRCRINLMGTLTLERVEDSMSFAKPDNGLVLKEDYVFQLAKHCEKNPKDCGQE